MQLILEHSKTDIEKIESIYCADTNWFEVTILINDEEKLIIELKNSIAGVDLSCRKIMDISYLSQLRNLKELEYVELFGNRKTTDFSPIEHVKEVKYDRRR